MYALQAANVRIDRLTDINLFSQNKKIFSIILVSQRQGVTCLPNCLGLAEEEFSYLLKACNLDSYLYSNQEDLRETLLKLREDEFDTLRNLLLDYRRGVGESETWMASILAAACLGGNHLWRDLGLKDRQQLSFLLDLNFPELARQNTKDMKWKKFFYKKLCEQEGSYVCRAPSCDQCTQYDACFGPEE